jgi:uncharacterized membrane protein (UPF0182 family)
LKQVIVAYQNQIVMEATLDAALNRLFGGSSAPSPPGLPPSGTPPSLTQTPAPATQAPAPSTSPLSQQALDHYRRALDAQRQGNWSAYGEEIKRVGEILQELSKTR